jgi:hypothetical protein
MSATRAILNEPDLDGPEARPPVPESLAETGLAVEGVYIYAEFYDKRGICPRGCHPLNLLGHVADIVKYREITPQLSPELVDRACRSYFRQIDPA